VSPMSAVLRVQGESPDPEGAGGQARGNLKGAHKAVKMREENAGAAGTGEGGAKRETTSLKARHIRKAQLQVRQKAETTRTAEKKDRDKKRVDPEKGPHSDRAGRSTKQASTDKESKKTIKH